MGIGRKFAGRAGGGSKHRRATSVGIKVLKIRLSENVWLAASGETIVVTNRDRVIARLGPLQENRGLISADALLAGAARSGVLAPLALMGSEIPPKPALVATLDGVLDEPDDRRRDR